VNSILHTHRQADKEICIIEVLKSYIYIMRVYTGHPALLEELNEGGFNGMGMTKKENMYTKIWCGNLMKNVLQECGEKHGNGF
jgi:hypothetical protein